VWWSPRHASWCCQIDDDVSFHHNERDAIRYGEAIAGAVRLSSVIRGEWC